MFIKKNQYTTKKVRCPGRVSCSCVTNLFLIGFGEENANVGQQIRTQSEDNSQKLTRPLYQVTGKLKLEIYIYMREQR